MYAGPGPGRCWPQRRPGTGWLPNYRSTASSYESVIAGMTDDSWTGPSSLAMEDAATPYVAWLNSVAGTSGANGQSGQCGSGGLPVGVRDDGAAAVDHSQSHSTGLADGDQCIRSEHSAIAANEAQYGQMWAQDSAAMYSYAANSAAAAQVSPFAEAPQTTSPAASAVQSAAVTQATGTAAGNAQGSLSGLISQALQSLATPVSATPAASTDSGLSTLLSGLESALGLGAPRPAGSQALARSGRADSQLLYLPGFFGAFVGLDALGPVMGNTETAAMTPAPHPRTRGRPAEPGCGRRGRGRSRLGRRRSGLGVRWGLGRLGQRGRRAFAGRDVGAAELGLVGCATSAGVPAPRGCLGAAAGSDLGAAGLGFPFAFGGLPKVAAVAAAAGVGGAAASKYASRLKVVARSPEAGYAPTTNRQLLRQTANTRCPRPRTRTETERERKRTRAAGVPGCDRVPADQRKRSGPQMTARHQTRCPYEVTT